MGDAPPMSLSGSVVVLIGPPGAKETGLLHNRIVRNYELVPIDTKNLLPEHLQQSAELGSKTKADIDKQEHVPIGLVVSLLEDRINKPDIIQRGCLLDGLPLSQGHAEAIKGHIDIDHIFVIEVPDQKLIERSARRHHSKVRARLDAYHKSMNGVMDHFGDKVRKINAAPHVDVMFSTISEHLGSIPGPPPLTREGLVIVVVAPPGAGKKAQCERIVKKLGFVHVCAPSLLSKHMNRGTGWGIQARAYTDRQERVPSELVVGLLNERMSKPDVMKRGCLLDGFPLCAEHVEAMKGQIEVDHYLVIDVPDGTLMERWAQRRLDPQMVISCNLKTSPTSSETCHRFVGSEDATNEKADSRLQEYRSSFKSISPLIQGKVRNVEGTQHPDAVFSDIASCLGMAPTPTARVRNSKGPVVVLSAPPAVCEEIQSKHIARKLGFIYISVESLLLKRIRHCDETGSKVKEYIDKQERVPSELIVTLLQERMSKRDVLQQGCLLRNFPLSQEHVKAMKGFIEVDHFVVIEVPDATLIERCVNRPMQAQAVGDFSENIARLGAYRSALGEMLPHFGGRVLRIDGTQRRDAISGAIRAAVSGPPREPTRREAKSRREPTRREAARHRPQPHDSVYETASRVFTNLQHSFQGLTEAA